MGVAPADGDDVDLSIFQDQEKLPRQVIGALARNSIDFLEQAAYMERHKSGPTPWEGGGILLPLFFQAGKEKKGADGEFVFLLNKRSQNLPQGGDLCAPGGGDHPLMDSNAQRIIEAGVFPSLQNPALEKARERGEDEYRTVLYYWSNALRESWEEIRLSAFNVNFLGPLPTYRLQSRRWIIFPLVGQVCEKWTYHLSPEVEKIVPVPLSAFYRPESYGVYSLEIPKEMIAKGIPNPGCSPASSRKRKGKKRSSGEQLFISSRIFLWTVFPFPLPPPHGKRVIRRPLLRTYLSGDPPSLTHLFSMLCGGR